MSFTWSAPSHWLCTGATRRNSSAHLSSIVASHARTSAAATSRASATSPCSSTPALATPANALNMRFGRVTNDSLLRGSRAASSACGMCTSAVLRTVESPSCMTASRAASLPTCSPGRPSESSLSPRRMSVAPDPRTTPPVKDRRAASSACASIRAAASCIMGPMAGRPAVASAWDSAPECCRETMVLDELVVDDRRLELEKLPRDARRLRRLRRRAGSLSAPASARAGPSKGAGEAVPTRENSSRKRRRETCRVAGAVPSDDVPARRSEETCDGRCTRPCSPWPVCPATLTPTVTKAHALSLQPQHESFSSFAIPHAAVGHQVSPNPRARIGRAGVGASLVLPR